MAEEGSHSRGQPAADAAEDGQMDAAAATTTEAESSEPATDGSSGGLTRTQRRNAARRKKQQQERESAADAAYAAAAASSAVILSRAQGDIKELPGVGDVDDARIISGRGLAVPLEWKPEVYLNPKEHELPITIYLALEDAMGPHMPLFRTEELPYLLGLDQVPPPSPAEVERRFFALKRDYFRPTPMQAGAMVMISACAPYWLELHADGRAKFLVSTMVKKA